MNYPINEIVIVRADRAGVFFGTLAEKEGSEVELHNARRLWYWDGACSISELAVNGTTRPSACKFSIAVPSIIILGVIEVIPCSAESVKSIESVPVWSMKK